VVPVTETQSPSTAVLLPHLAWLSLFDSLPDALFVYRGDGTVTYTNSALQALFGGVFSQGPKRAWVDNWDPDGHRLRFDELPGHQARTTGRVASRLIGVDVEGTRRWLWAEAGPLAGSAPGEPMFYLRLRDLTEQVATVTDLQQRDQQFRLLAEHTSDVISHHTIDGATLWVSPSLERVLGWTPLELTAMADPWSLMHPEDAMAMLQDNMRVRAGEEGVTSTARLRHREGHWVWLETTTKPGRDESGAVAFMTCAWRDVTQRMRDAEELHNAQETWRQAIATSSIGGVMMDSLGRCLQANDAICELFRVEREQLIGHRIDEAAHLTYDEDWPKLWHAVLRGERDQMRVGYTLHRSDEDLIIDVHLSAVRTSEGELRFMFGQMLDVTEREQSIARLRDSEEIWRRAVDSLAVAAALMMPDGQPTHLNDAMRRLLGLDPGVMPQNSLNDFCHPDDRPAQRQRMRQIATGARSDYCVEARIVRTDGRILTVETHVSTIRRDDGAVAMFAVQLIDITEQRTSALRLAYAATHDRLTGLANREEFGVQVRSAIDRLGSSQVAVLSLDLDRFTLVNDSLGHEEGDRLLAELSASLAAEVESCVDRTGIDGAVTARLGGDEFGVLLEGVPNPRVAQVIADLLSSRASRPLTVSAGGDIRLSVAIGVAVGRPDATAADLMQDAAAARYRAKQRGRDRVATYDSALRAEAQKALRIRTRLAATLDAGVDSGLTVAFQPVIDFATGRLVSAEALSRWHDSELGVVSPVDFIPVAEETGLIQRLGRRVLGASCAELARWRRDFPQKAPDSVAVNLSPTQFSDVDLAEHVMGALTTYSLPPEALCIEITESVLLGDAESTMATIDRLTRLGVHVALDDFGTGWSSLTYLRKLPVSQVKIDRSFVEGLGSSAPDEAIVEAINSLCHNLDKIVIAEGVETQEQLDSAKKMGIDRGQGYLLGRPVSGAEFARTWLH
jgi:diguanylate cyclase (GGDEF)-like protein/PAS domain S-box-containing protein